MKTYIAQLEYLTSFYPPLSKEAQSELFVQQLFTPLRTMASTSDGDLVIKEELNLIGRAIIEASEKVAKNLRSLGYQLQIKKIP